MVARVPDNYVEIEAGKTNIYIDRDYLSLTESLAKEIGALAVAQRRDSERPPYEGRGRMHTVAFGPRGEDKAVIKHYQRGGMFRCVFRDLYCGSARFWRELHVVERAKALGIPTAEALALVTERRGLFFYRAHLVTKEIPSSVNLAECLHTLCQEKGGPELLAYRSQILSQVASLLKSMHRAGIYHADLNLKNILVQNISGKIRGYVIDLDRARYAPPLRNSQRLSNLVRLYRSLEKMGFVPSPVTAKDIRTFIELYCKDEPILERRCRTLLRRSPFSLQLHRLFWKITKRDARPLSQ